MSKYNNRKMDCDGYTFDSISEWARYLQLKDMERAGEIHALEVHPVYKLFVNNQFVCKYVGDFSYTTASGAVTEDVKSSVTCKLPTYRLKKKLVKACLGIDIVEVSA
jgi:Protein of unknown function (DUF1064)